MFNKASIRLYTNLVAIIKHLFIARLWPGLSRPGEYGSTTSSEVFFDNINTISAYQISVILDLLQLFPFLLACKDRYSIPLLIKLSPMVGGKSPGTSIH